jgi:hypothetical protein
MVGGCVVLTAARWWGSEEDDLVRASARMAGGVERRGRGCTVTVQLRKAEIRWRARTKMEAEVSHLTRLASQP